MRQMTEFEKFQDEVYFQRVREMELTARQAELRWRDILWEKLKTICWSIGWTEQEMVCAGSLRACRGKP